MLIGRYQAGRVLRGVLALAAALVMLVAVGPVAAGNAAKITDGSILIDGPPTGSTCPAEYCTVDATGKNLKVVLTPVMLAADKCACSNQQPTFSGDGARVAFVAAYSTTSNGTSIQTQDLWVMNANGKHLKKLTAGRFRQLEDPSWSPNGKTILFSGVLPPSDGVLLYSINANGTGLHTITPAGSTTGVGFSSAKWSPDGSRIAYVAPLGQLPTGKAENSAIFVMNANGTNAHQVTPVAPDPSQQDPQQGVSWAPNGKWLVFSDLPTNWLTTHEAHIYRINVDGSGMRALTSGHVLDDGPIVSPDGSKILYSQLNGATPLTPNPHVYVMNANGTGRRVFLATHAFALSWTPKP